MVYCQFIKAGCRVAAIMLAFAVGVSASQLMDNLAAGRTQVVVVYGTSLSTPEYGPWVAQMRAWLDARYPGRAVVVDSGMSGSHSTAGLEQLAARVLAYRPDTVFIEFAVNDAANLTVAESKSNLNTMLDRILAAKAETEIILQTMNGAWDAPNGWKSATARAKLADYYQGYREVAAARGLLLIDHYPAWADLQRNGPATFQAYVPDGVHPTAAALAVMTTPRIQAALDPRPVPVRLPKVFSDNLVLQRGRPVPVWGWGAPGETVCVEVAGVSAKTTVKPDGTWKLFLPKLKAGGPYELVVTGKTRLVVKNVLVGDVWLCSGQSNMTLPVKDARDGAAEVAKADHPRLRAFNIGYNLEHLANRPQGDFGGGGYGWQVATPQTVPNWSAISYYFGRELGSELDVPIGLIHCSWGATGIQTWCPREVLLTEPRTQPAVAQWDKVWTEFLAGKASGHPNRANNDSEFVTVSNQASGLFNGGIAPVMPYGLKGVIWYQGESNTPEARFYRQLFPALITGWRRAWGQGDFPFLYVQLANFGPRAAQPGESDWAELREAQLLTLKTPHTAMSVTIDLGEEQNIHPLNKQEVGRRLALAALGTAYGKRVAFAGPRYIGLKAEGDRVRLRFAETAGGLVAKGGVLKGFAVAGADRKFVWAEAKLAGDSVLVWSRDVPRPVAVRYGWAQNPECTLYNRVGLPAGPFRTDDWPGITQ
jgi:sialate O-acetylesterase